MWQRPAISDRPSQNETAEKRRLLQDQENEQTHATRIVCIKERKQTGRADIAQFLAVCLENKKRQAKENKGIGPNTDVFLRLKGKNTLKNSLHYR